MDDINRAPLHCQGWITHSCTVCVYWCVLCLQLCGIKTKDYRLRKPMVYCMIAGIWKSCMILMLCVHILTELTGKILKIKCNTIFSVCSNNDVI